MGRTPMFELWTIENALDANKKSSDHFYSLHFETCLITDHFDWRPVSLIQHNLHHIFFIFIPDRTCLLSQSLLHSL